MESGCPENPSDWAVSHGRPCSYWSADRAAVGTPAAHSIASTAQLSIREVTIPERFDEGRFTDFPQRVQRSCAALSQADHPMTGRGARMATMGSTPTIHHDASGWGDP